MGNIKPINQSFRLGDTIGFDVNTELCKKSPSREGDFFIFKNSSINGKSTSLSPVRESKKYINLKFERMIKSRLYTCKNRID